MGRRGPAPTPTAILRQRGSWRANARKGEPSAPAGAPPVPERFDEQARSVWQQVVATLSAVGVLSQVDGNTLERYCRMLIRWRAADDFLKEHGEVYPVKDKTGKAVGFEPFPQVGIVQNLALALLRIEQEFGLTPSARSRITVQKKSDAGEERGAKRYFFQAG